MKQVAIASGKGGTGKTSLVASFANFANAIIADCDVDAPNLHLILNPEILEKIPFEGMELAEIDNDKCIKCGKCKEACRFGAIENFKVIEEKCEGCGVCQLVCPVDAIRLHKRITGYVFVSRTRFGGFVYGLLSPGEEASGKLVSQVRKRAEEMANKEGKEMIIIDSPAGIGCPVIASIGNTDLVVIVTEATMAAINDMERVIRTAEHFRVKTVVVVNKYDINKEMSKKIEEFCMKKNIDVIGRIPFSRKFVEAMVEGKSVVEYDDEIGKMVKEIWENMEKLLENG